MLFQQKREAQSRIEEKSSNFLFLLNGFDNESMLGGVSKNEFYRRYCGI